MLEELRLSRFYVNSNFPENVKMVKAFMSLGELAFMSWSSQK